MKTATFAGGCFWCIESAYNRLAGVHSAISGYTGGPGANPSYKEVCGGRSGHVEAVQIRYDPAQIDYDTLLRAFFALHDPTTLNRQGNDVGPQYASVLYYHDEEQRQAAERMLAELAGNYPDPVVTRLEAAAPFYPAEDYHQQYFDQHGHEPYCQMVVAPKLAKFQQYFSVYLKK